MDTNDLERKHRRRGLFLGHTVCLRSRIPLSSKSISSLRSVSTTRYVSLRIPVLSPLSSWPVSKKGFSVSCSIASWVSSRVCKMKTARSWKTSHNGSVAMMSLRQPEGPIALSFHVAWSSLMPLCVSSTWSWSPSSWLIHDHQTKGLSQPVAPEALVLVENNRTPGASSQNVLFANFRGSSSGIPRVRNSCLASVTSASRKP